jgi:deoxyribodipyrimidine photo-lyase
VAGTSIQKQYLANQELINKCSDPKQHKTYLDIPIDTVSLVETPEELKTQEAFHLTMHYPESDKIDNVSKKTVFLYHPWSIDPLWRKDEVGELIFVLEPRLFDKFPVSPRVLNHIMKLLKTHVPGVKVFVGNVETIPGLKQAKVFSKAHPATAHFEGHKDVTEELFPHVKGYYQSFFKFWQVCQDSGHLAKSSD